MSKKSIIIAGIIISLSIFLRVYHLGSSSLWIDEGYSINASLSIMEKGLPELDSGSFYRQGILYNYLAAGLMKVFGFDPFSPWPARFPAVLFGIFSVIALFFLTRKLFNEKVAVLSSFILGLSAWQIAWSQQARGYTGLQFFIILSFYFLWQWLNKRHLPSLLYFALSFAGAYFSHTMAIVFLPPFLIIIIAYKILHSDSFRSSLSLPQKKISYIIGGVSLALFGFITYISFPPIKVYGFYRNYLAFIENKMFLFAVIAIIGAIIGLLNKKHFWPSLFLIIAFSFPFLTILEYGPMEHMRYLFPLFFITLIFFCYAVFSAAEFILSRVSIFKLRVSPLLLSLFAAVLLLLPHLAFLPRKHYPLNWGSPQPNFKEAYSIIEKEKKEEDIVISPYTHLSKIYLGDPGIWFPISLPGRTSETDILIEKGMDRYTGAPLIESKEHFFEILDNENGFVVLDMMAIIRLRNYFQEKRMFHPKIEEIYQSGEGMDAVWLYKF